MTDKELKLAIQQAIIEFSKTPVYQASIELFKTLGYNTARQNPLPNKSYDDFRDSFLGTDPTFNEEKACVKEWKSIDLLFQLTADEVSSQSSLFDTKQVDNTIIETYLFFSIELTKAEYNRTQLAQITREINKVFPMPVLIVFKHGESITLSVINRRLNKKDAQKDVLAKVTVIKDISATSPHRAHIEILFDLSFAELQRVHKFTNFVELHNAWQKTLDTKELNKRFYRDLSNWYFWAHQHVRFPNEPTIEQIFKTYGKLDNDILKTKVNEHKSLNLIRMLTRLLFIWFIKEKGLIPEEIFDLKSLQQKILNKIEPTRTEGLFTEANKDSVFYKAILQNLFFAVLNCPISEKDKIDKRKRGFSKKNFGVLYLMRYESYFKCPNYFLDLMNNYVPFLNGGLFDCLDIRGEKEKKDERVYIDGFSDNLPEQHQLIVPDYIFFGTGEHADLSEELGDKKQKDITVSGLINILKSYKFTITENTPIEEDIALDPELLGRVFENLLASYNPETKTTARKQTGSFYTPREIVNYMVDESLKAYLKQKLEAEAGMKPEDAEVGLEFLVGYNEKTHLFDDKQTAVLINAIDNCKILDPACGSGAFPMGILHKLVHILHKLDPNNKLWKERQIEKAQAIDDSEIRDKLIEDIETSFNSNELDYGRKLYLIENCIYGVDIQPIATQISKLRFFISLIVDQKTDKSKDNFGIRPLPNLETKFVAANTLIGIEKPKQQASLFDNPKVQALEIKLKDIRHRLFSAKTPATKRKLREEDQRIREEMGALLVQSGWGNESAHQLSAWDPYNQNVSSGWFDPEWMFGIEDGFDVVIGNPPYLREKGNAIFFQPVNNSSFGKMFHQGKMDFWFYFLHKSVDIANNNGSIAFITPRYWINSSGASKLIQRIHGNLNFINIVDIGKLNVFESVAGQHMISVYSKSRKTNRLIYKKLENDLSDIDKYFNTENVSIKTMLNEDLFTDDNQINFDKRSLILNDVKPLGELFDVSQGVVEAVDRVSKKSLKNNGNNEFNVGDGVFVLSKFELESLNLSEYENNAVIKKYLEPTDIEKYRINFSDNYLIYSDKEVKKLISKNKLPNLKRHLDRFSGFITSSNKPYGLHRPRESKFFENDKIIFKGMFVSNDFCIDKEKYYVGMSFSVIIQKNKDYTLEYLLAILNSKFANYWFFKNAKHRGAGVDVGVEKLRTFLVRTVDNREQQPFIKLVDQILTAKKANPRIDTTALEKQIDQLVYKLYDLTEDKIAIIEGSVK